MARPGGRVGGLARARLLSLFVPALVGPGLAPGFAAPADRIEIAVSRQGFRPDHIATRKGEPIRISLTTSDGEHCFALDAFRVEKRVVPGRPSVVDLTPDRAGTFPFYDCLADAGQKGTQGRLVVTE
jgi:heme/copper-type cytochrome/quinol oxidase subunit 2